MKGLRDISKSITQNIKRREKKTFILEAMSIFCVDGPKGHHSSNLTGKVLAR